MIQQLCKLSLEGLNCNKLIFTLNEIKVTCPNISAILGAIYGLGLLQALEHFNLTGTTMTLTFLQCSYYATKTTSVASQFLCSVI